MLPKQSQVDSKNSSSLQRRLGTLDGAALIVSNVIGIGIFTTPGLVAGLLPNRFAFIAIWIFGGLLALIGGSVYAELGGRYPDAGGEYVYIREGFGSCAAFLSGWTSLIAGFSGAIAAGAVGLAVYLDRVFPGIGSDVPVARVMIAWWTIDVTPQKLFAVATVGVLTLVHLRGIALGRTVQNVLALLSTLSIVALVAAGLLLPTATPLDATPPADGGSGGLFVALVLVMFTYSGWNAASYLAGELRSPARTLHRSLLIGLLIVTALYLGLNAAYLRAVPFAELRGAVAVADRAAGAVLGEWSQRAVALVVALALVSGVSAMVLAGPRVYFAMARDGVLPRPFGRVSRRSSTPSFSIAAQSVWSCLLIATGGFKALVTYTGFAVVLFSGVAVAALFVVRRRANDRANTDGVRAWGYPWAPLLFLSMTAAMLVQSIRYAPAPSLAGAALMLAGLPLYFRQRRVARAPANTSANPVSSPICEEVI